MTKYAVNYCHIKNYAVGKEGMKTCRFHVWSTSVYVTVLYSTWVKWRFRQIYDYFRCLTINSVASVAAVNLKVTGSQTLSCKATETIPSQSISFRFLVCVNRLLQNENDKLVNCTPMKSHVLYRNFDSKAVLNYWFLLFKFTHIRPPGWVLLFPIFWRCIIFLNDVHEAYGGEAQPMRIKSTWQWRHEASTFTSPSTATEANNRGDDEENKNSHRHYKSSCCGASVVTSCTRRRIHDILTILIRISVQRSNLENPQKSTC